MELPAEPADGEAIAAADLGTADVRGDRRAMATKTKSSTPTKGRETIHRVMKEKKEGTLKSGSGKKVKSRKQAIAIALNEARKSGAKIPKKKKRES